MLTTELSAKRKVMVYVPSELVDEADDMRHTMRRYYGVRVDRSALISAALRLALHEHPDKLAEELGADVA